ncbi:PilZ domain-containing protein [Brucella intermedia]|uniref:PilZ domain-containing protein n=1 Tax=Brucella intermedia TaxID=94625 RepID=UPI00124CEB61|nr:PilZ domain-containing protein [Brucella intermedia]KAB2696968.1 PilZ domain-containing protein [Brucella intermedia]
MNRFAAAPTASNVRQENFNAVNVDLNGRYMLENRSEFPCVIKRMSPGTAQMSGIATPRNGERIIAYIDHVGRIEGIAHEVTSEGFHILLATSEQKKDKLSAQLTWLANKHELALPEDRRHERVVPHKNRQNITFADGTQRLCRIADLSLSGAAIESEFKPAIKSSVMLGPIRGTVVRHFQDGFAIEFATIQTSATLDNLFG